MSTRKLYTVLMSGDVPYMEWVEIENWCKHKFGVSHHMNCHYWISDFYRTKFTFALEQDAILFTLRWQ